jgi:hypothetical protein
MGGTRFDFSGPQSLSSVWSSESRGPRLHSSDFETKTLIRAGGNTVEAILVLPVTVQTGICADGTLIAQYPVYAAMAVDQTRLNTLTETGLGNDRHLTLSEATQRAAALNAQSETAYLNDYQSGTLSHVGHWEPAEPTSHSAATAGIILRPAVNQTTSQTTGQTNIGMKS